MLIAWLLACASLALWAILDIKRDGRVQSLAFVKAALVIIVLLVVTLRRAS